MFHFWQSVYDSQKYLVTQNFGRQQDLEKTVVQAALAKTSTYAIYTPIGSSHTSLEGMTGPSKSFPTFETLLKDFRGSSPTILPRWFGAPHESRASRIAGDRPRLGSGDELGEGILPGGRERPVAPNDRSPAVTDGRPKRRVSGKRPTYQAVGEKGSKILKYKEPNKYRSMCILMAPEFDWTRDDSRVGQ